MKRYLLLASVICGGAAYAGCGDNAVLRVDQAAMIFSDTQAELHGAYAWEASPDQWATHPVGGSERGYVRFSCGTSDTHCKNDLLSFVGIAQTGKALQFGVPSLKSGVRPGFFSAEGTPAATETPPWPIVINRSPNQELWSAIQALPPLQLDAGQSANDAGTSANDAGTENPRGESDGGDSLEQQPRRGCAIVSGAPLLMLGILLLVRGRGIPFASTRTRSGPDSR
jgi:hypothetical protein